MEIYELLRDQWYCVGWYPNQSPEADGLPKWTSQNRDILETDIVLWYKELNDCLLMVVILIETL